MKKNERQPEIELLPSPAAIVRARTGVDEAELHRLVQQKVAEIMAERDALVFEPFFRSRQIAYELKRLQSVPEQRKWSISFERYGCLICETRERSHAANGMCSQCHARWFARLTQIIAEGIKGEPARPARGTPRAERLLPTNGPSDGVHRCWYERSNETDKLLYRRVAKQLGVTPSHVRLVAHGQRHSEAVSAALREESKRLFNGGEK
ncbi:MAG: hypothetical protein LAN84_04135 [Acidobacteriia bacterium]|nr:hypothetical protein [Terriglobia bacterium]